MRRTLVTTWTFGLAGLAWFVAPFSAEVDALPVVVEATPAAESALQFVVDRTAEREVAAIEVEAPPPAPERSTFDPAPLAKLVPGWVPPTWHPNGEALAAITEMTERATDAVLGVRSRAVFVYDVDSGEVLYERAADDPRPVASLTKLMSSLALAAEGADLDEVVCVDEQFLPGGWSRSKFRKGDCYVGWDLLGAALVASDNRAAYGLQVLSGMPYGEFIRRMDEVSRQLGMTRSLWADPSGLEDDNMSTARDMTRAVYAVAMHPDLSIAATAPYWRIERVDDSPRQRTLYSTNRFAPRKDLEFLAAKTGFTNTAGYCFSAVVRTDEGRTIAFTTLGAPRSKDRWRDVERILSWVD